METSPLICSANQWVGFYMIGNSVMKELIGRFYIVCTTKKSSADKWCVNDLRVNMLVKS